MKTKTPFPQRAAYEKPFRLPLDGTICSPPMALPSAFLYLPLERFEIILAILHQWKPSMIGQRFRTY